MVFFIRRYSNLFFSRLSMAMGGGGGGQGPLDPPVFVKVGLEAPVGVFGQSAARGPHIRFIEIVGISLTQFPRPPPIALDNLE